MTCTTRFMVISDTHNFSFDKPAGDFKLPLPKVDVLLHCGDLTHYGGISSYKRALSMLGSLDAELKLVIAGNHDIDLDRDWWMSHLDDDDDGEHSLDPTQHNAAIDVMTGPLAAQAGVTYLNEGTHSFTLASGAQFSIYTSPYTPEFCDWAFPYARDEDRFNPPTTKDTTSTPTATTTSLIPTDIDIILTHGPPKHILDACPQYPSAGCPYLLSALQRVRPRMHCFGHIHESHGAALLHHSASGAGVPALEEIEIEYPDAIDCAELGEEETLMVNAAIMDGERRPVNKPWLVDLPLKVVVGK